MKKNYNIQVWSLKTANIPEDQEGDALLKTFEANKSISFVVIRIVSDELNFFFSQGHGKGVYPMVFVPSEVLKLAEENNNGSGGNNGEEDGGEEQNKQQEITFEGESDEVRLMYLRLFTYCFSLKNIQRIYNLFKKGEIIS